MSGCGSCRRAPGYAARVAARDRRRRPAVRRAAAGLRLRRPDVAADRRRADRTRCRTRCSGVRGKPWFIDAGVAGHDGNGGRWLRRLGGARRGAHVATTSVYVSPAYCQSSPAGSFTVDEITTSEQGCRDRSRSAFRRPAARTACRRRRACIKFRAGDRTPRAPWMVSRTGATDLGTPPADGLLRARPVSVTPTPTPMSAPAPPGQQARPRWCCSARAVTWSEAAARSRSTKRL